MDLEYKQAGPSQGLNVDSDRLQVSFILTSLVNSLLVMWRHRRTVAFQYQGALEGIVQTF